MVPVHEGLGPWWLRRTRGIRRWWARRRLASRVALVLGAGFVALVVWGAVSAPSKTAPGKPPGPSATPGRPASRTPEAPVAPTGPGTATTTSAPAPSRSPSPPLPPPPPPPPPTSSEPAQPARPVYFDNCDDARAAGAAPLLRGGPGYRDALDRDGDGVACEPYFGH
ncbi:excalibur calcium-binding domain-containing protein [Streptomyces avidinii]